MPFYNPGDRLPDPDWVIGDDAARGINQPPEEYMPDEQRRIVADLRDDVSTMIDEIKGGIDKLDFLSVALDKHLPVLYESLSTASRLLDVFHSETVGSDWREPTGEREDYEDR